MFFDGLKVKCFAFLPCNQTEKNETDTISTRRSGSSLIGNCINDIKPKLFNSILDYAEFMKNYEYKEMVMKLLEKSNILMTTKKKNAACVKNFSYLIDIILNEFEKIYLKPVILIDPTESNLLSTDDSINLEENGVLEISTDRAAISIRKLINNEDIFTMYTEKNLQDLTTVKIDSIINSINSTCRNIKTAVILISIYLAFLIILLLYLNF